MNGYIDEARIRNVASSDEWVAAEYATLQPGFVVPMAQPSSLSRGCTIAATNLAAGVVLTNFPLMVKLTASNKYGFSYADAAVDGSDVRFFDADDMQLFHEVASWNQVGESVLYVSVPRLSRDTVVTMRWHKKNPSTVLPPMPASAVWTAAGYKFVWHLDRYDSTIGGYANSVSTNYPAKPVGTAPTVCLFPAVLRLLLEPLSDQPLGLRLRQRTHLDLRHEQPSRQYLLQLETGLCDG